MADRRGERERLRRERLAAERSAGSGDRARLMLGYLVAGILGLSVLVGLVLVIASGGGGDGGGGGCSEAHVSPDVGSFNSLEPDCREGTAPPPLQQGDLELAAKQAGCEVRLNLREEGNSHVPNTTPVAYSTNPPTSGNHNPTPVADGAYLTPLRPATDEGLNVRNFVHSLEHGRIEIQYSSDLPEADQLALKGVFDEDPGGVLLFPDDEMPYEVAVTAWTKLVGCPRYNERVLDVVRDFRDIYRGQGPEAIPIVVG
jgi:hypothetical protein